MVEMMRTRFLEGKEMILLLEVKIQIKFTLDKVMM
jgi:hypothetical protein